MKPCSQVRGSSPSEEPVSLDEAKAQCRVTHSDDDAYLTLLIEAVRELVEETTHRALVEQQWIAEFRAWPGQDVSPDVWADDEDRAFQLPRPPLISVSSVKYYDTDGDQQTVSSSDYIVDTRNFPGEVIFKQSFSAPSLNLDRLRPITVTFMAGFGSASSVPERAKLAIKILVHHFYVNRIPVADVPKFKVPFSLEMLLGTLKRRNV